MLKRVRVEELRPGDFIKRFDCGWLEHPFLFSSRKVDSPDEIERIKDWGISHVYIESSEGAAAARPEAPLPPPSTNLPAPTNTPTGQPTRLDPKMLHVRTPCCSYEVAQQR